MDRYVVSVALSPSFPENRIKTEALRLIQAVEYLHAQSIIDMDIKGDNIFVRSDGNWYFGDFGSACYKNDPEIRSTTTEFYHERLSVNCKPECKYDWFMLFVRESLVIEEDWSKYFVEAPNPHVSYNLVTKYYDSVKSTLSYGANLE